MACLPCGGTGARAELEISFNQSPQPQRSKLRSWRHSRLRVETLELVQHHDLVSVIPFCFRALVNELQMSNLYSWNPVRKKKTCNFPCCFPREHSCVSFQDKKENTTSQMNEKSCGYTMNLTHFDEIFLLVRSERSEL